MKSNLRHKMAKVIECAITQALARDISVLASSCSDDRELIDMGKGRFSAKVLEDNFNLVWALIDASEFPCLREQATMTKVMHNIDEANKWRLSGGGTSYARMGWARWEADKIRYIWAYFLRLNARAAWSHSIRIVRLKQHYQRSMADLEPVRPLAALPDYPSSPPDVEPHTAHTCLCVCVCASTARLCNHCSICLRPCCAMIPQPFRRFITLPNCHHKHHHHHRHHSVISQPIAI